MKKTLALFIATLSILSTASAAEVSGWVYSSVGHTPLPRTEILLDGRTWTETSADGGFVLPIVSESNQVLRVKKDGFVGTSVITGNTNEEFTFELAPVWQLNSAKEVYFDVPSDVWFEPAVRNLYENHALSTTERKNFRPADTITRAELISLAVAAAGFQAPTVSKTTFCDVSPNDWFAPAVEFAAKQSWISGSSTDECASSRLFHPSNPVNRAEAVKILLGVFADRFDNSLADKTCVPTQFSDVENGAWFEPFVRRASCLDLVNGYSDNTFRPANSMNRAEAAAIINQAASK